MLFGTKRSASSANGMIIHPAGGAASGGWYLEPSAEYESAACCRGFFLFNIAHAP